MLVIISDVHLTDGSSNATMAAGAFKLFAERLADLAESASWRAGGTYRPVERVDLVLLGDMLDLIRSSQWLSAPNVRPWNNISSPEGLRVLETITRSILDRNATALGTLRSLSQDGLAIPVATAAGKSERSRTTNVPVRTHYMVGNHDWFFHMNLQQLDPLRQMMIERMGLANQHNQPFAHEPNDSPELLDAMRRHRLFARHGDIYDPFNFAGDRSVASLGDVVVIELLTRFAGEINAQLAGELPAATLSGLGELDNLRPSLLAPIWIEGLLERTCPWSAQRTRVKRAWDRLVDEFLELDFIRQQDTWSPCDLVDSLQRVLKFSKLVSLSAAGKIASWLENMRSGSDDSYYRHALGEQDFRNRRAKHIVYGHTHAAESVPLDASSAEGYALNQVYFNSGTWRRVHRQTKFAPREHEFIASETMTYLAFFSGDERGGRSFETWSGTLAVEPDHDSVHRLDAAVAVPQQAAVPQQTAAPQQAAALQQPEQPVRSPSVPVPHFPAEVRRVAAPPQVIRPSRVTKTL